MKDRNRWGAIFKADVERMAAWVVHAFGRRVLLSPIERADRALEEATELHQAVYAKHGELHFGLRRARAITDYVYTRPPGDIAQEMAGSIFTVLCLAYVLKVDLDDIVHDELCRVESVIQNDPGKLAAKLGYKHDAGISDFREAFPVPSWTPPPWV